MLQLSAYLAFEAVLMRYLSHARGEERAHASKKRKDRYFSVSHIYTLRDLVFTHKSNACLNSYSFIDTLSRRSPDVAPNTKTTQNTSLILHLVIHR